MEDDLTCSLPNLIDVYRDWIVYQISVTRLDHLFKWCKQKETYISIWFIRFKWVNFQYFFSKNILQGYCRQQYIMTHCALVAPYHRWSWSTFFRTSAGPHLLTFNPSMDKCIQYKVLDENTYPFPYFNGVVVEVLEWRSNFIEYFTGHVIN